MYQHLQLVGFQNGIAYLQIVGTYCPHDKQLMTGGALWAFAEIAEDVMEGDTHTLDRAILLALRDADDPAVPIGPTWLLELARDVTSLGGRTVLTLLTVGVVGFLLLHRKLAAALLVAASICGGGLLSSLLKVSFDRARPDSVLHAVQVYSASFPSGHAMLATTTYLTLGALLAQVHTGRRAKLYLLSWAVFICILVGSSRIYLGVHWPTDVLAGWCIGSAWALMCGSVALWLKRKGKIEPA
jgi:undecaprenyl-diphosphatase